MNRRKNERKIAVKRVAVWTFRVVFLATALAVFALGSPDAARSLCRTSPLLFFASLGSSLAFDVGAGIGLGIFVATFFKRRFFCRYCCPLGTALDATAAIRRKLFKRNALKNGLTLKTRFVFVAVAAATAFSLLGVFFDFSFGGFSILAFDPLALISRWTTYFPNVGLTAFAFVAAFVASSYFWRFNVCPCGVLQDATFFGRRAAFRFFRRIAASFRSTFAKNRADETANADVSDDSQNQRRQEFAPRRRFLKLGGGALFLAAVGVGRAALELPVLLAKKIKTAAAPLFFFRPPGALSEDEFLTRCARCGRCVDVCPTKILRPVGAPASSPEQSAPDESDVKTDATELDKIQRLATRLQFGSPQVIFNGGYCEKDCVACSNACPTGALTPLTPADKKRVKMARIEFDVERCLLYYQQECSICRRECPFEAIDFVWSDEEYASLPVVDADKCVGCGRCVAFCPGEPIFSELSEDGALAEAADASTSETPRLKALTLRPLDAPRSTFL